MKTSTATPKPLFTPFAFVLSALLVGMIFAAHAGTVQAPFNDNSTGNLAGQQGGSGWNAGNSWTAILAGGGPINVTSGDLSAPPSTGYAVTQSGTAQQLYNASSGSVLDSRLITGGGLTGGTVWFSFIAQVDAGGRAGIEVDDNQNSAYNRVLLRTATTTTGTGVNLLMDGAATSLDLPGSTSLVGTPILVVARLTLNTSGALDTMDAWVNPNVASAAVYNAPVGGGQLVDTGLDFDTSTFAGGAGVAGVQYITADVYAGGHLDNIIASDDADAYYKVTGFNPIPEPSSLALFALGAAGLAVRRRHQAR